MTQINSKVELRQFAIEQANILASRSKIYTVDNLIDAAKTIEKYIQGKVSLPDIPEDNTKLLVDALAKSYNKNPFKMDMVTNNNNDN